MADWKKTDEPGIYRDPTDETRYLVDTTAQDPDGTRRRKRRTLTDATMLDAIAARGEIKAAIRAPDPYHGMLFADFAREWMTDRIAEGRWADSTERKNRRILKHHIIPHLGPLYIDEIDRTEIERWIRIVQNSRRTLDGERVPYAHSTLRSWWSRVKELVRALYLAGHCDRLLVDWCSDRRGPTSNVTGRKESRTLTSDELGRYVEMTKEHATTRYAEIVTLAYTGMRAGELYGLDWSHIDFDTPSIKIRQSVTRKGKLKPPKTGPRTAPLVPLVARALQDHRRRLVKEQSLGLHEGIVFPATHGGRRLSASIRKPMLKIARLSGLDVNVGPQVLRSTFATLMGNARRHDAASSIAGHSTQVADEHYRSVRLEDLHQAVVEVFGESVG